MTSPIPSYPKVYALGHRALENLISPGANLFIQEKVDGSQISFGVISGELHIRSKNARIDPLAPEGMFANAVRAIRSVADKLKRDVFYRGEYLQSPKHNTLCYERAPKNHIALFDVERPGSHYGEPTEISNEAARLGFDHVPVLTVMFGSEFSQSLLNDFLKLESFLGGVQIEGVVVKNYTAFTPDGKVTMGKFVSEAFKESHQKKWGEKNPNQGDILEKIADGLNTEARFRKAVQHLRERGELAEEPKDIGPLMKELRADIESEEADAIKEALYAWASKQILRRACAGFPQWYKTELAANQFKGNQ